VNQDDNAQLILQLETAAAPLGGAHRHHDLLIAAARRIRELDTEICELHFLAGGTADNEMLYEVVDDTNETPIGDTI
jgi:hypothetical protein